MAVGRVDRFQREHAWLGFPIAVVYKYFDDQGNYLAAIMTYYAFIAIFPLMLLGTSILGLVLEGKPNWQQNILNSALSQFPIIGDQLGRPDGLHGSVPGVVFGAVVALYGSLGLAQSLQNTAHIAWSVPRNSRPNPIKSRLKSLLLIFTAGVALLAISVVTTLATTTTVLTRWMGNFDHTGLLILTVLVVGLVLTLLFQFAAAGVHSFKRAAPGGFLLAVLWQLLQVGGSFYVQHVLIGTSAMTKTFGLVLGLFGFLYIGAVMAVLSVELNVVIGRSLFPRALLTPFTDHVELTDADRRAYASYAKMQRHKGFQEVVVQFDPEGEPGTEMHQGPSGR